MAPSLKINKHNYKSPNKQITGKYTTILGEVYYCIENYDQMPLFFMSLVSDTDHWIFISSSGGLTAGRKNTELALFPYETDDKVTESYKNTGPLSIFLITQGEDALLWEPFSERYAGIYNIERKIYKNISGNKLIFEESNTDLGLTCRQAWRTSDRFGFILTTWLHNKSDAPVDINLLSGVRNILPYGVTTSLQTNFSNLLNAYKRNELDSKHGIGIFNLNSKISDLAEPSESLKATIAWQTGLEAPRHLLSIKQVDAFRRGEAITQEVDIRGVSGAYILNTSIRLSGNEEKEWSIALDVNQDIPDIVALQNTLMYSRSKIAEEIEVDIARGSQALNTIVANADGLQISGDALSSTHHYANTLFNTMRGGIFADNYQVEKADFIDFLQTHNRLLLKEERAFLNELPASFNISDLLTRAEQINNPNLERLCFEYLPLTFSRRHGDPSRPWNKFSINIKNDDGGQRLDYQGNWRDIFQNWEPIAASYPEFVESMIAKFVNAGTPDGYNPYRVTRAGVEWEEPEPKNPWSNIGYWSDHQIIYLEKLLEISAGYHPGKLNNLLTKRIFSYVNVPYRIREYSALLDDPYNTIDFDLEAHQQREKDVAQLGTDGKLVRNPNGDIFHVTLSEKLLVFLLAKLSNFVPEGGIWMNTQRPEWNDANNALAGKGLSVVTLGYLRRYIVFLQNLYEELDEEKLDVSKEVNSLFDYIHRALSDFSPYLSGSFSGGDRRSVMDALGQAGSDYRQNIYEHGFSGKFENLSAEKLKSLLELSLLYVEHALRANRRPDNLFHSYNILKLGQNTAKISYLNEMLEGQVAILSSGLLSPQDALSLLKQLRKSALYREDQHSYILYPDRKLPSFLSKNCLPAEKINEIGLVQALVKNNESKLVIQDEKGGYHFNGEFHNFRDVEKALERLSQQESYKDLVTNDGEKILAIFEEVFQHDSFTGRSGAFFAYEGLGSIYWHMVAKLLLAVQENYLLVIEQNAEPEIRQKLAEYYYDIRQGLGFNKAPEVYGTFPTDPYSHTPKGEGAKQPGMTGQVKEEILTRFVEMGVFVKDGEIIFSPMLLRKEEFLTQPAAFEYIDLSNQTQNIQLPENSLAFTFCQTPIIYLLGQKSGGEIYFGDGQIKEFSELKLSKGISEHIFKREGAVKKVLVFLEESSLLLKHPE